jgi:hypothetical protein
VAIRSSRAGARADAPSLAAEICRLYEQAGLSTRRIADTLGVGRRLVERTLREQGVAVAPRGAGRKRPTTRHPDPDDLADQLRELYENSRLTRQQVSEKLGLTEGLVRTRLAQYGIPTRSRGGHNREDRLEPEIDALRALYVDDGMTAAAAGERLDVTHRIVLRTAHDHGLPVRQGAAAARSSDPVRLIEALYADPLVAATLTRHNLRRVPPGGPIWQRFPQPLPLTTALVRELYVDCGVSITHIELLTGQPATKVRRLLHDAEVPIRSAGGRSPFRRRWASRERDAADRTTRRDVDPDRSS